MDADRGRVIWRLSLAGSVSLIWSDDGRRLLVARRAPLVLDASGRRIAKLPPETGVPAAFQPHGHALASVAVDARRSTLYIYSGPDYRHRRIVFAGAGYFTGLAWSPDARWLLIDWRDADQWIFVRSASVRRIAVRNIGNTFDSGPEHYATIAGWCCP
jgi:hypothetical protein